MKFEDIVQTSRPEVDEKPTDFSRVRNSPTL